MKKVFTDYPLSDAQPSGYVEAQALAYDRNKYVMLRYDNQVTSVKSGYLRDSAGNYLSRKALFSLPCEVGARVPSAKDVAEELKAFREHSLSYQVHANLGAPRTYGFKQLADALRFMRAVMVRCPGSTVSLSRIERKKNSYSSYPLLVVEHNDVYDYDCSRERPSRCAGLLAKKHFRNIKRASKGIK